MRPRRAAVLLAAAASLALVGCATLPLGRRPPPDGGQGAEGDTAAAGDTAAGTDTVARAGDGASLRDSVLAVLEARRAAKDTAPGEAGADGGGDQTEGGRPSEGGTGGDGPSGPVRVADADSLRALGPVYTPYDVPPLLQRDQRLEGILRATILPVIRRHDLEPDEWARFWVLVDREGRVVHHRLHLTSGHYAFDQAAAAAAESLRYRPARRGGEPVPVWVLVRISLLMG